MQCKVYKSQIEELQEETDKSATTEGNFTPYLLSN